MARVSLRMRAPFERLTSYWELCQSQDEGDNGLSRTLLPSTLIAGALHAPLLVVLPIVRVVAPVLLVRGHA